MYRSTNCQQDTSLAFIIMVYPSNAINTGRGGKKAFREADDSL
jgi:hypothetical protein